MGRLSGSCYQLSEAAALVSSLVLVWLPRWSEKCPPGETDLFGKYDTAGKGKLDEADVWSFAQEELQVVATRNAADGMMKEVITYHLAFCWGAFCCEAPTLRNTCEGQLFRTVLGFWFPSCQFLVCHKLEPLRK